MGESRNQGNGGDGRRDSAIPSIKSMPSKGCNIEGVEAEGGSGELGEEGIQRTGEHR